MNEIFIEYAVSVIRILCGFNNGFAASITNKPVVLISDVSSLLILSTSSTIIL